MRTGPAIRRAELDDLDAGERLRGVGARSQGASPRTPARAASGAAPAQALERKHRGIGARRTGRRHHQDLPCDRLEVRAEMHRALERQDRAAAPARCRRGGTSPGRQPAPCFEASTTRTLPCSSTAIGPSFIAKPLNIGPVHVKLPSASATTLNSPASGTCPGTPDVSPRRNSAVRPIPSSCACLALARSISSPSTASRGSRSMSAASRPVVSPLPPAPGLSCVSASTTGAPTSPRCAARADGIARRVQVERELGLGIGNRAREAIDGAVDARLVGAIAEHRHLALGKVGHRKARREGEHGVLLALDGVEQVVEAAARLDEGRLRRQAREEVERPHRPRQRCAALAHA